MSKPIEPLDATLLTSNQYDDVSSLLTAEQRLWAIIEQARQGEYRSFVPRWWWRIVKCPNFEILRPAFDAYASSRIAQLEADKAELREELHAYREGGLTEEILRRNDGCIKVGHGCAIVVADDHLRCTTEKVEDNRQIAELQAECAIRRAGQARLKACLRYLRDSLSTGSDGLTTIINDEPESLFCKGMEHSRHCMMEAFENAWRWAATDEALAGDGKEGE